MSRKTTLSFLFLLSAITFSLENQLTSAQAQVLRLECAYIKPIEQTFFTNHLKIPPQDELYGRIAEQYIKNMDPLKVYFVEADVEKMKSQAKVWVEKVRNRDCAPLFEYNKLLQTRMKERADFVRNYLGPKFKFDSKTEFVFDLQKKMYPKTQQEAEDFLSKYIQFQISNYLATDIKLPEAKKNVTKNWDRNLKRMAELKNEDIFSSYLDAIGTSLDPHSSFMSRELNEDFRIAMNLSLQGIGATLSSTDGFTQVEALVPGGAADKSGKIKPQDKILSVAQGASGKMESVIDMDLREVVQKIRGKKGSIVRLLVLRKDSDGKSRFEVTLVRDEIKLEDEAAKVRFVDQKNANGETKKIAILQLPSFYAEARRGGRSSASDMKVEIAKARKEGADGMILDLSTNPGGSLDDAVRIAGLFIATGNVVKQSAREDMNRQIVLRDTDPAVDWSGPLVVLTSRLSASASEIVAGTLKDYKRAVIVGGDHTFGKGTVQQVLDFPPGNASLGAAKITVGMFFTPGGFSTQHRGVDGDITLPSPFALDEIGEKSLDYSVPPKKIDAFLSPEARASDAFQEVQPEWIKTLAQQSKDRVDKNPEFKKILEELEKTKSRGKIIKVGDAVKDKEKKEKAKALKTAKREEKDKEYLKRPEIQESINILSDLMGLMGKGKTASR